MRTNGFLNSETVFYLCFLGIMAILFACGALPPEDPLK